MGKTSFFYESKAVWSIAAPSTLLILFMAVLISRLSFAKVRPNKILRGIGIVTAIICLLLAVLPVGDWVLSAWEQNAPHQELPAHIDGIVILGGALDPILSAQQNDIAVNDNAERVAIVPQLMQQFPQAKIVYTGGSGSVAQQDLKEADLAKKIFASWHLDLSRFVFERDSRNTFENARNAKNLVQPKPGEFWLLITSVAHMRRAMAVFTKAGWPVTPYPVDFRARWHPHVLCLCFIGTMEKLDAVAHEAIGLTAYHLTGKAQ